MFHNQVSSNHTPTRALDAVHKDTHFFVFTGLGLLCNCGSLQSVCTQCLPKRETRGVNFRLCTIVCCGQFQPSLQEVPCYGVVGISLLIVVIPLPQPVGAKTKHGAELFVHWCVATHMQQQVK